MRSIMSNQQRSLKIVQMYLQLSKQIKLINKLIYGQNILFFNDKNKFIRNGVMYLHQNSPEILVILGSNGDVDALDFKKMDISVDHGLNPIRECILLQDFGTACWLVFDNKRECETVFQQIKEIKKKMCEVPSETDSDILKNFIKADKNRNRSMDLSQFSEMLKEMKLESPEQLEIINNFLVGIGCEKQINLKSFQLVNNFLSCRKQFLKIFEHYSHAKLKQPNKYLQKLMKREQFMQFLKQIQKQTKLKQIAKQYFTNPLDQISFCDFSYYLLSKHNNVLKWDQDQLPPIDEKKPLNAYFCYSSHNTYLTGNQISGESSVERYYDDLVSGVRCVQIDTMDGSQGQGPLVSHRFTLTSNITFADVLEQIQNFSTLHPNHTPIILSIDNGCDLYNQRRMAELLKKKFKQNLFTIKDYSTTTKSQSLKAHKYPTLQSLRGKIIVKCAGSFADYQKFILTQDYFNDTYTQIQVQIKAVQEVSKSKKNLQDSGQDVGPAIVQKEVKLKVDLQLLKLTAMLGKGKIFHPVAWESVSMTETVAEMHYQKSCHDIQLHVQDGWIRSYPKFRADSSNFDPYPSLEMGIQMIALNSQYGDEYSCLMRTFFQYTMNKCTGYRERPPITIPQKQRLQKQTKQLKIKPVSGSKIYYDNIQSNKNPVKIQLKMKLFCLSHDRKLNAEGLTEWLNYTEQITNNAFNPVFLSTTQMVVKYTCPWLTFVGVKVQKAGIGFIPVLGLKKGIRFVELYDQQFIKKESKIFVQIQ